MLTRYVVLAGTLLVVLLGLSPLAWSGSPHLVACAQAVSGDTLTLGGKEAGLGDESQVQIQLSATALCVNGGSNHPKAANKTSVTMEGTFPVQNGQALFQLSATATFQPACSPPMSVLFTDVTACDIEHGVCCSF